MTLYEDSCYCTDMTCGMGPPSDFTGFSLSLFPAKLIKAVPGGIGCNHSANDGGGVMVKGEG